MVREAVGAGADFCYRPCVGNYQYQATDRVPETYGAINVAGFIGIVLNAIVIRDSNSGFDGRHAAGCSRWLMSGAISLSAVPCTISRRLVTSCRLWYGFESR